ncbi:Mitochondrial phosphate carrier protein 3, mitochondrial, partial [Cucurbita argyrosperma subsp. sororia]
MALSDRPSRQSLIPSFLYSSPSSTRTLPIKKMLQSSSTFDAVSYSPKTFAIPAPSEPSKKIELYSPAFYAACTFGGILSCGLTHMTVTPLDLVKCNMQIDPAKYKSISSGFGILLKEQGVRGFFRGWVPTLLGYSAQGACKFGFYEFFKKYYSDIAGPEYAAKYKTLIYLAGSASAEVIADVALCPFEAVKVRVQTQPGFARGLADGLPKFVKSEGTLGLYKGIVPLWGRQIPYTMMKFASFETIVEMIYKYAVPTPKDQCSKSLQLGISFAGGYVAGVFCAIVSHPADNLVSFLNNAKGATVGDAVKKLGLWGLFTRGLPLRIVMIGTLTGAQWGIYDAFKVFVGLPTTGGVAPAAPAPSASELANA